MPWYWFLPIALFALALTGFGLHMLVRRLGDQGLVDYTPHSPSKKSVGSAMVNFGVIYDPSLEHVIEFEQSGDLGAQGSSEPLRPNPDQADPDQADPDQADPDQADPDQTPKEPGQETTPGTHS